MLSDSSFFQSKTLLHYSDNSNEIVDTIEIETMKKRCIGTKFEKINWNNSIIEIPSPKIPGKYFIKYMRNIPIHFQWFTQQKQIDLFFEILKFGVNLEEAINYTKIENDILKIITTIDLGILIDADRTKSCENLLISAVGLQDQNKVTRFYYNETTFLNAFVAGNVDEYSLDKRKAMNIIPTHLGKQFVNRNMPQMVAAIIRKGKTSLGDKMFELFQEYTNISIELFIKNVQMLGERWKNEGNTELASLALRYCGLSHSNPTTSVSSDFNSLTNIDTELLKRWTGMRNFRIIFEKTIGDIDLVQFNQAICGRKNMMIIVFAEDGSVFGSYSSIDIPQPLNWIKKDAGHFIFTLINHQSVQPTRFYPLKLGNSVYIFQNDYMISVIAIQGAFKINLRSESNFSSRFSNYYNDSVGQGSSIFVKNPEKFIVKSLMVLEFY
ncbi:hypothetical protein EDI_208200 [Entamoeba dispar SAW760]|uniref:TLDc domain-containing protein n=1 Tax=Entamoeba dispar (strain ATCC PRA-260 / SAW760) TaxID=370354 RepID=B0EPF5_ENTDS|nr:uncharacterized protein EDI_208200 [Entamoeba dispar SAW760]EDR23594.1 hypothetical protein EDI_208200 [Entamoeba dispar SAW760]|eukprot:EDR23594.1 hypothetical protein EDI_208200 [Entamoeba dispar SAW760]